MYLLFLDQSHIQLRRAGPKGPHVLAGLMDDIHFAGRIVLQFSLAGPTGAGIHFINGWKRFIQ